MPGTGLARLERSALCDLLLKVGPAAPTLCEGWSTADLATHLVVRERKPIAAPGIVFGGPPRWLLERAMARTKSALSYDELVAMLRNGPPFPMVAFDGLVNLVEYFVHHEDVRRANGDDTPRMEVDVNELEEVLWRNLRRGAALFTRSVRGFGLDLVRPDDRTIHARKGRATATIAGRPGELTLYLMGRKASAEVEVSGDADAVATVRGARFGL